MDGTDVYIYIYSPDYIYCATVPCLILSVSTTDRCKQVICRIRPPTSEETSAGVPIALEALGEGEVGVRTAKDGGRPGAHGNAGASWRSFTLDKALGPSTSQEEVFRQVRSGVVL